MFQKFSTYIACAAPVEAINANIGRSDIIPIISDTLNVGHDRKTDVVKDRADILACKQ